MVARTLASDSPNLPASSMLWTLTAPIASSPTMIGTPRYDLTAVPTPCRSMSSNCSALFSSRCCFVARIREVRPSPSFMGALGAGLRRSVRNGKSIMLVARSSSAMYTMSARNVVSSCSPVRWIRRSRSSCAAAAWPTSLMMASSLARCRVSPTRRAFSSATLRLAASVVRSRSSEPLNAFVRSTFWSEMLPRTSAPTIRGAKSMDFAGSPLTTFCASPRSWYQASTSLTSSALRVSIILRAIPPIGKVLAASRTPFSIAYG